MYLLAEEIIDGVPNEKFIATNKFEDSEDWWITLAECAPGMKKKLKFVY